MTQVSSKIDKKIICRAIGRVSVQDTSTLTLAIGQFFLDQVYSYSGVNAQSMIPSTRTKLKLIVVF